MRRFLVVGIANVLNEAWNSSHIQGRLRISAGVISGFANRSNAHVVVDSTRDAVVIPTGLAFLTLAYRQFLLHLAWNLPRYAVASGIKVADR